VVALTVPVMPEQLLLLLLGSRKHCS
jgi:hypothetical protein